MLRKHTSLLLALCLTTSVAQANVGVAEKPLLPLSDVDQAIGSVSAQLRKHQYNRGQFLDRESDHLMQDLRHQAKLGNLDAQADLGDIYYDGVMVKQDLKTAVEWYRLAANQDYPYAQLMLGVMYQRGLGVDRDAEEAVRWFKRAERQPGLVAARRMMGERYADPNSHLYHPREAIAWYERAAAGEDVASINALGDIYQQGIIVPNDGFKALRWYGKAAALGSSYAEYNIGLLFYNGQGVEQDYRTAARWFQRAAMRGSSAGQYNLGELYYYGKGMKQDYGRAYAWWTVADIGRFNSHIAARIREISEQMSPQQLAEAVHMSHELKQNITNS